MNEECVGLQIWKNNIANNEWRFENEKYLSVTILFCKQQTVTALQNQKQSGVLKGGALSQTLYNQLPKLHLGKNKIRKVVGI